MEQKDVNVRVLQEMVDLIHTFHELHDAEVDCGNLQRIQEEMADVTSTWRVKQSEKRAQNLDLQRQVAEAERRLVSAKMAGSNYEELELARENLAQAQSREKRMQTDVKDLEECIEAIDEQMSSIKLQKETLDKPDTDEAFLKNELSLFLNVSSILPDLGEPKFSGTFVDKHRGVKTFKFPATEMSQFETCKAAWNLMK